MNIDDILNLSEDERYHHYLKSLDSEMKSRPNYEELKKKIIISDNASFFVHSYMRTDEYNKLKEELGAEGIYYHPFCTKDEIIRILNPKKSKDILLQKQAAYIVDHMRTRRVFTKRKEIYESNGRLWSLTDYYDRDKNFSTYLNKLKPHIKRQCKLVEAGFVFMAEPNGRCEKTAFGNIIYLSESLSYFLHFMNFSMLNFYGFQMERQQRNEALFIGLRVMLGIESLDFDLDPRYDSLPADIIKANNELVKQQLMFIIGHEYAHHALGHLNNSKIYEMTSTNVVQEKANTQKFYTHSQKQEFEADWFSFKNAKLTNDEKNGMLNGAFLFFIYIDIFETLKQYMFPQSHAPKRHPEPLDRLWKLRKNITNSIGYSRKELEEFINDANHIKQFLLDDILPYKSDFFEFQGSLYLSKYKTKHLIDRIDY